MFFGRRPVGVLWLAQWAAIVLLATLIADCLYVMWPYPGEARGVAAFEAAIEKEWHSTIHAAGHRLPPLVYAIHERLYGALFEWTGLDYLMQGASIASAPPRPDALMGGFVRAADTFLRTATAGLQLFSLRLGVLALSTPFIGLIAAGAAADGLVRWYCRRTGGGRESGFIFHRAKRAVALATLTLCFAYLVPPITINGGVAVTVFSSIMAITIRLAVGYFKKHI